MSLFKQIEAPPSVENKYISFVSLMYAIERID